MENWATHEKSLLITGLDTADVVRALFNAAGPRGPSFLDYEPRAMGSGEAHALVDAGITSFDEWRGRKLDFEIVEVGGEKKVDVGGYEIYNGKDTAELAIAELRATGRVDTTYIMELHERVTLAAANFTKKQMKSNFPQIVYSEGTSGELAICLGHENVTGLKEKIDEVAKQIKAARRSRNIEDRKADVVLRK